MKKVLEFLNKYLFIFLFLAYLINKFLNTELQSQQLVLKILVALMVLNMFLKFYFLKELDQKKGTKTLKLGLLILLTAVVLLVVYAITQGIIF